MSELKKISDNNVEGEGAEILFINEKRRRISDESDNSENKRLRVSSFFCVLII